MSTAASGGHPNCITINLNTSNGKEFIMNKLTRISATVASSVALVAGFAGVAGAAPSIDTTGPDSSNRITHRNSVTTRVHNDNDVRVTNNNPQRATSGDVRVNRNTTVDGVSSGGASNDSMLDLSVSLDNSGATAAALDNGGNGGGSDSNDASISLTGPDSDNRITDTNTVRTTVNNDNDIRVTNNNRQTATSGNVNVTRNTTVGDVTSGDASNVSTTTFDVNVTN
jgi:hypothetical protein